MTREELLEIFEDYDGYGLIVTDTDLLISTMISRGVEGDILPEEEKEDE